MLSLSIGQYSGSKLTDGVFVPKGSPQNAQTYVETPQDRLFSLASEIGGNGVNVLFQHDKAPTHTAATTPEVLKNQNVVMLMTK